MKNKNNILQKGSKNLGRENWMVFHPNGKHMFTCNEKKAEWYLTRNLAEIIEDKQIQFTFTPKGNGFHDNEIFGKSVREVRCVVTGKSDNLQRHHIVPYCYRSYFPEKYKSKNHHDVVLMNHDEHEKYERCANEFKTVIADIYDVKKISELNFDYTVLLRERGKKYSMLLNDIHTLIKSSNNLPYEVKIEKLKIISQETQIDFKFMQKFNYIQLYKLFSLIREKHINEMEEFKRENRYLYDHGYHLIQKLKTEDQIKDFVKLWRNHFLNTTKPKYMPNGWSVDFRIKTNL